MLSQHIPGEETGKRSKKMRESNLTHSTVLEDSSLKVSTRNEKTRKWGLFVTGVVGGTLMTLYAIATPFVAPAFRKICLPYVPATNEQIRNVLKMLQLRSGHLVDIGSGDGRIVNFSPYTNVVIFGVPPMMPQLEKKLQSELGESARVVACRFPFPHWVPDHVFGQGADTVWVYDLVAINKTEFRSGVQKQCRSQSTEL
ncbi:ATP synthase subunit C lysine N-methyltransferase isoform X5 [Lithobates pipiens]